MMRDFCRLYGLALLALCLKVGVRANGDGEAVFIREFSLIRRDHLPEDFLQDTHPPQKAEDPGVSGWAEIHYDLHHIWHAHYFTGRAGEVMEV
ncbi:unnamed protein product [Gadus morhua 'NCC']